jgi:hypothetical protein
MEASRRFSAASATFDPKTATNKSIIGAVEHILKMAGCTDCGRLSRVRVDFVVNPAQVAIPGVTGIEEIGTQLSSV